MTAQRILAGFVLSAVCLLAAGVCAQAQALDLAQQQADNKKWEDAARKLESDLVAEAQRLQTAKRFAEAGELYRRALSIQYEAWDIQESRSVGGTKTLYPSLRKVRRRLDTTATKTAREKLAGLDAAVAAENESVFRKNATEWNAEARDAVKDKKPEGYVKAYLFFARIVETGARLPATKPVTQEITKAQGEMKKIVEMAAAPLTEAENLLKDGKVAEGIEKFNECYAAWRVVADYDGDLRRRVFAFRTNPDVRNAAREQEAVKRVEAGDAALARGDHVAAIRHYRGAITGYPDLPVSEKAAEKLGEVMTDPKAEEALKELDAETRARAVMARIESLIRLKRYDEARTLCNKLASEYPESAWGIRAREKLEAIRQLTGR